MPKREFIVCSDDEEICLSTKKTKKPTQQEINAERFVWTVSKLVEIFRYARATDRDICRKKVSSDPAIENVERLKTLNFVDHNYQIERYYKTATNLYRHEMLQLSFRELLDQSREYFLSHADDYIEPLVCEQLLYHWFYSNGLDPQKFIAELYGVLSGASGKHNTFYVQGLPNAGKTFLFSLPIEAIMTTVGRIVTINTGDRFVFENCVNQRLISIEECAIPPQHIEEMKKLMGGEHLQIDVKNQREGGAVTKTPVICSSNSAPWALVMGQEEALKARMYYYQVNRPYAELAHFVGQKFNPVVWCDILREYSTAGTVKHCFIKPENVRLSDYI